VRRFLFGRYVEGDLREIRDHVSKDSPESARRLMVRFIAAFRLVAQRPELGHVREDLPVPALRFWPVGSYLITDRKSDQSRL
jgi:plasmid stabilization system protein ParE